MKKLIASFLLLALGFQTAIAGPPVIWDANCASGIFNLFTHACLANGSGGVSNVTATAPITSSGGASPNIACLAANSSQEGCLLAADWSTFNSKQAALSFTAPIVDTANTVSCNVASGSQPGCLSSADWSAFNSKQSALSFGNLTEATSSILTILGGTGAVIGSGTSIQVTKSDATHSGYLSSSDWNTFNGKQSALTFSDSIVNTSGNVTLVNDSATPGNSKYYGTNGSGILGYYTLGTGSGTVTSVALADGSTSPIFTISGSPVTTSGTLTETLSNQLANKVFAGPTTGSAAQPTFRSLVSADIPSLAYLTSINSDTTAAQVIQGTASDISVSTSAGTTTVDLINAGTAGTYTKVTTDAKGRVTTGASAQLASSDFANQGTTTTVLHGNAAGNPSFGAVSLTADVSGILPEANGGTHQSTYTTGDLLYASGTNTLAKLPIGTTNQVLEVIGGLPSWQSTSVSTPTWAQVLTAGASAGSTNPNVNENQMLAMRLENLSSAPSPANAGRVWFNTTSGLTQFDDGSAIHTDVDTSTAQTLTNKTMSGSSNTFSNIPDGALSTSYIKADGTRALTGQWNSGQVITTTQLGVNNNSPASGAPIDIVNTSGSTQVILTTGYGNSIGHRGRYANGTLGTPTAATSGNVLEFISGRGYGTTGFASSSTGVVNIAAGGTFTDTSMPTYIAFMVTPTSSVTSSEAARVNSTGDVLIGTTTDNGTDKLQVNGNINGLIKSQGTQPNLVVVNHAASPYTLLPGVDTVLLDTSGGVITVNLPAASSANQFVSFVKTTSDANAVTVNANGSDTIDGAASMTINSQFDTRQIQAYGPNNEWYIRSETASGAAGITQLQGDVSTPSGGGLQTATLATVNSNVGTFPGGINDFTVNGKGLITAVATDTKYGFNYLSSNTSVYGGTNSTLSFTGADNWVVGVGAGAALTTSHDSIFEGWDAGNAATTANFATVVGSQANGTGVMTGADNSFFGYQSGKSATSGADNLCAGYQSCSTLTTGADNVIIGSQAVNGASASNNVVIGEAATAANFSSTIEIGATSTAAAANATAIGFSANAGNLGIALGFQSAAGGTESICIGYQCITHSNNTGSIAIGDFANNVFGSSASIAIGQSTSTTGTNAIAIGNSTTNTGTGAISMGADIQSAHNNTASFGYATATTDPTTAANQLTFGTATSALSGVFFGNGATAIASPSAVTLGITPASGSNTAGANVTWQGGNSTGTGAGGQIIFQTAAAGTTGSSANSFTTAMNVTSDQQVHIRNALNSVNGSAPTLSSCGTGPSVYGTDTAFTITGGTGATGCVATFANTHTNAPTCVLEYQNGSLVSTDTHSETNTAVTMTNASFGVNKVDVICVFHD